MKKLLFKWAIGVGILYLCTAFFYMDPNPATWSHFARFATSIVPGIVLFLIAMHRIDHQR